VMIKSYISIRIERLSLAHLRYRNTKSVEEKKFNCVGWGWAYVARAARSVVFVCLSDHFRAIKKSYCLLHVAFTYPSMTFGSLSTNKFN
jgi:hypothetical protein